MTNISSDQDTAKAYKNPMKSYSILHIDHRKVLYFLYSFEKNENKSSKLVSEHSKLLYLLNFFEKNENNSSKLVFFQVEGNCKYIMLQTASLNHQK